MEFAFESFLDDFHVQQAEETAAETKTQRVAAFGFEGEAAVVELQAIHRIAQFVVLGFTAGVEIAVDHLLDGLVAGQLLRGRGIWASVTVSPMRTSCRSLMAATMKTHFTGTDAIDALGARDELAQFAHGIFFVGAHEADFHAFFQFAIDDADVDESRRGSRRRGCRK